VKVLDAQPEEDEKRWMKCSLISVWTLWLDMDGSEPMSVWEEFGADENGVYTG
jgi:hypothetical protein